MAVYFVALFLLWQPMAAVTQDEPASARRSVVEEKLLQAFPDGTALRAQIRLFFHDKSMVLAAQTFDIEPDGRIKFTGVAIAWFGKNGKDEDKETTAILSSRAYVELDRPISTITELGNRSIRSLQLANGSRLTLLQPSPPTPAADRRRDRR